MCPSSAHERFTATLHETEAQAIAFCKPKQASQHNVQSRGPRPRHHPRAPQGRQWDRDSNRAASHCRSTVPPMTTVCAVPWPFFGAPLPSCACLQIEAHGRTS